MLPDVERGESQAEGAGPDDRIGESPSIRDLLEARMSHRAANELQALHEPRGVERSIQESRPDLEQPPSDRFMIEVTDRLRVDRRQLCILFHRLREFG